MDSIQVALADDHEMFNQGLAILIGERSDIEVVGTANNGMGALKLAETLRPDVLVLDYSMPDISGKIVTERLHSKLPEVKVIILTTHESASYASVAFEAGAMGYLLKSTAITELVQAIKTVYHGDNYITPEIRDSLLDCMLHSTKAQKGIESLSKREFQLLCLLSNGNTLRQSALNMCVADSTAATYRKRIMEKLNLNSTSDIIRFAIENKLG